MKVDRVRPSELAEDDIELWSELQRSDAPLDSPFLRPEFAQAIGAVREDAEVAVIHDSTDTLGFFPYQRTRWGRGRPLGAPLSDFHGPSLRKTAEIAPKDLIRKCGLRHWHFDHLPAVQAGFRPSVRATAESRYIDLSEGFDAYCTARREAGSRQMTEAARKQRKLEREVGELRFEFHTSDSQVFERLLAWKSEQLQRMGGYQVLRFGWVVELLDRLRNVQSDDFSGVLSAVYAGETLVGVHLGLRTRDVFHVWFPTYNSAFSKYSPGAILLIELARSCGSKGIERIDLGKGDERYKSSFGSAAIELVEGSVDCDPLSRALSNSWFAARDLSRQAHLKRVSKRAKQVFRQFRYWSYNS